MMENLNTPELRFPGFEGEWKIDKIGEYIDLISGYSFKGNEIVEDNTGICILRGINITEGYIRHSLEIDRFYLGDISKLVKYILKTGDLVLGMDGSKVGKNVALIGEEDNGSILVQRVARLRGLENADIKFIYTQIFSSKFHRYVDVVNTSSGIPHISAKQIRDFVIGFPTLPEQQKIASFFTSIDKKIELLKKKHSLLEQYKKGVMQKIFAQKIRFKDSNGNDYADWEERKLGEVADIIGGGTPSTANYNYWNGEIDWFTPTEIKANYVIHSERKISTLGLQKSSAKLLPKGTLLLTTRATIGEVSIAMKECTTNQGFQSLVAKSCDNIWLYYWIKKNKFAFIVKANGSTFPEVSKREIEKLKILAPCLQEQTKIANFLSSIDKKIEKVQLQIDKAEEWKKGLLGRMFC